MAPSISLHGKLIELLELNFVERFVVIAYYVLELASEDHKLCLGQKLRTTLVGSQHPSELLSMTVAVSWLLTTGKSFGSSANVSGLTNAFLFAAPSSLVRPWPKRCTVCKRNMGSESPQNDSYHVLTMVKVNHAVHAVRPRSVACTPMLSESYTRPPPGEGCVKTTS
jgi:hypothetical protein